MISAWNFVYLHLSDKKNWANICIFCNSQAKMRPKRLKKTKNIFFYKCVLEFNFASTKVSVFFISLKSQIPCTLVCSYIYGI
jgi:hypothetical protein